MAYPLPAIISQAVKTISVILPVTFYLKNCCLEFLGKRLIGVKGEIATEPQLSLRVITPTAFEAVDPAKVGHGVTSSVTLVLPAQ